MQAYIEPWQAHGETMQALQSKTIAALAETTSNQRHGSFPDERAALFFTYTRSTCNRRRYKKLMKTK